MDQSMQRPRNNKSQDSQRQTSPKQARSSATNKNSDSRDSSLPGTSKSTPRNQSENRERQRHESDTFSRTTDKHQRTSKSTPRNQSENRERQRHESDTVSRTTDKHQSRGLQSSTYHDDYGVPMQVTKTPQENRHKTAADHRNVNMHSESSVDDSVLQTSREREHTSLGGKFKQAIGDLLSTATFGNFGNNSKVNFKDTHIDIQATNIKSQAKQEDLKCSQPKDLQPDDVAGEYVNGLVLQWSVPEPRFCKVTGFVVTILSDSEQVFKKEVTATSLSKRIPDKILRCGTRYRASIKTIVEHNDGEIQRVESDWNIFVTRPSRPEHIKLECDEEWVNVQWSACKGAEKFEISIFNLQKRCLDHKETLGTEFKCQFKIDNSREIRLGEEYFIEVVATLQGLKNRSKRQQHFFGMSNSPQSVAAKLIEGTNRVLLAWKSPGFSFSGYTYVVEVISNTARIREMPETTSPRMEISDLKGGMSYTFRVATIDGNVRSLWSTSNTIKTQTCTIKVEKFELEDNTDDLACSFVCVWDQVQEATGYKIRCKGPDKVSTVTVGRDTTKYTLKELVPNTEYKVSVKAEDLTGYGPYADEEVRLTGLGKPSDVQLRVTNGNEIAVSFTEAQAATGHNITLSTSEESDKMIRVKQGRNAESFIDLAYNTEYWATVAATYREAEGSSVRSTNVLTAPKSPNVGDITSIPEKNHPDSAFTVSVAVDKNTKRCQAWVRCMDAFDEDLENYEENVIEMNIDEEKKRAFLRYKCFYKGAMYSVRVRTENNGGYSEWSERKLVKTAPKKIDDITIAFDNEKVSAKWQNVRHTSSNTVVLFEANEKICVEHDVKSSPFTFQNKIGHGLEYFCQIYPENDSGCGRTTTSNVLLIPLDPPSCLSMEDEITQAKFAWQPSTGMLSAHIRFSNTEFEETSDITKEHQWTSPYITYGEAYTFTIWARNGRIQSEGFLTETFVTAPSEVVVKRNPLDPETSLDVEIVTNYTGPFLLTWFDDTKKKTKLRIFERCFTIENLKPATVYSVQASCFYGGSLARLSEKCNADKIMTLPGKVSDVRCISHPMGYHELLWNGCGNKSVKYKITWSRNNAFFTPITTYETSWKFKNLESGSYAFLVSAGGGKKSDECFIIIPDAPQIKVEVLSWEKIRVVLSPNTAVAERHLLVLKNEATEESFNTDECEFTIDEKKFSFIKGAKHTIICKAFWNDHSSLATKKEFITGLEKPSGLTCELNHSDAHRPVKFAWNNSKEMFNAKIQLREMDNSLVVEESTSNSFWEYWGLKPNRTYELFLWPGDGRRFYYEDCLRHKFITAPGPPRSVRRKLNKSDRTSKFDIEIDSDYSGPFLTKVVKMDGKIEAEHSGCKKSFTIDGLSPGTTYYISAQCVFEDYISEKTFVKD